MCIYDILGEGGEGTVPTLSSFNLSTSLMLKLNQRMEVTKKI